MILSQLTDAELAAKVDTLCRAERRATLDVLLHLIEVDRRHLYAALGFSSLFDFCVRRLRCSEAGASRRVAAARCIHEHPELASLLVEGKVSLCSISAAADSIRKERITCDTIVERSAREVKALVAPFSPRVRKPAEIVRPVALKKEETPLIPQPTIEERYELRFTVTKEVYERLEEAKNRLSNALGKDLSVEAVMERLLKEFLKERKGRPAPEASSGRRIPEAVKREVFRRDKGRCTYCAPDGTRCESRKYLNFDHLIPVALGGESKATNLRLLCSAHNQHEARRILGTPVIRRNEIQR